MFLATKQNLFSIFLVSGQSEIFFIQSKCSTDVLIYESALHEGRREKAGQKRRRNHAVVGSQGSRGVGRQPDLVDLGLLKPLGLGSSVLEPDFHLSFGQLQVLGKFRSLGDGKVLLLLELVLQGEELLRGEGGPRLPVSLVLAEVAAKRKPRVTSKAVIEGCRCCRHSGRVGTAKHRISTEGVLVGRRWWWSSERRNSRQELRHGGCLSGPGPGVGCCQVVQVVGVAEFRRVVHHGRLTAGSRTCAGGRRWRSSGVPVFRRWGPRRDGGAGQLGLGRHPEDVVHAEGRSQLAALLLLDVHRDVVGLHVRWVVRTRRERHRRHQNTRKDETFASFFADFRCDWSVRESKTIWRQWDVFLTAENIFFRSARAILNLEQPQGARALKNSASSAGLEEKRARSKIAAAAATAVLACLPGCCGARSAAARPSVVAAQKKANDF